MLFCRMRVCWQYYMSSFHSPTLVLSPSTCVDNTRLSGCWRLQFPTASYSVWQFGGNLKHLPAAGKQMCQENFELKDNKMFFRAQRSMNICRFINAAKLTRKILNVGSVIFTLCCCIATFLDYHSFFQHLLREHNINQTSEYVEDYHSTQNVDV